MCVPWSMLIKLIQIKAVSFSSSSFSLGVGCKSFSLYMYSFKMKNGEFLLLHVSYSWVPQLPRALFFPLMWKSSIPLGTIDRAPNCCFSLGLQNIKHQSWDGVGWGDEKQSNQHTVSWIKSLVNINFVLVVQKYFTLWHLTNCFKLWQS